MFDVSFTELLVIALVALIVIGPDQLPQVLRTLGKFTGIIQREFDVIRRDFYNSVYTPASELKTRLDDASKEAIERPKVEQHKKEDGDGSVA